MARPRSRHADRVAARTRRACPGPRRDGTTSRSWPSACERSPRSGTSSQTVPRASSASVTAEQVPGRVPPPGSSPAALGPAAVRIAGPRARPAGPGSLAAHSCAVTSRHAPAPREPVRAARSSQARSAPGRCRVAEGLVERDRGGVVGEARSARGGAPRSRASRSPPRAWWPGPARAPSLRRDLDLDDVRLGAGRSGRTAAATGRRPRRARRGRPHARGGGPGWRCRGQEPVELVACGRLGPAAETWPAATRCSTKPATERAVQASYDAGASGASRTSGVGPPRQADGVMRGHRAWGKHREPGVEPQAGCMLSSRVSSGASCTAAARESFSAWRRSTWASRSLTRCRSRRFSAVSWATPGVGGAHVAEERLGHSCRPPGDRRWWHTAGPGWVQPGGGGVHRPTLPRPVIDGQSRSAHPRSYRGRVTARPLLEIAACGAVPLARHAARARRGALFACVGCGSEWVPSEPWTPIDWTGTVPELGSGRAAHPRAGLTARAEVRRPVHERHPHDRRCRSARTAGPPDRRPAASGRSSRSRR